LEDILLLGAKSLQAIYLHKPNFLFQFYRNTDRLSVVTFSLQNHHHHHHSPSILSCISLNRTNWYADAAEQPEEQDPPGDEEDVDQTDDADGPGKLVILLSFLSTFFWHNFNIFIDWWMLHHHILQWCKFK